MVCHDHVPKPSLCLPAKAPPDPLRPCRLTTAMFPSKPALLLHPPPTVRSLIPYRLNLPPAFNHVWTIWPTSRPPPASPQPSMSDLAESPPQQSPVREGHGHYSFGALLEVFWMRGHGPCAVGAGPSVARGSRASARPSCPLCAPGQAWSPVVPMIWCAWALLLVLAARMPRPCVKGEVLVGGLDSGGVKIR